jgi:hypothetical protein
MAAAAATTSTSACPFPLQSISYQDYVCLTPTELAESKRSPKILDPSSLLCFYQAPCDINDRRRIQGFLMELATTNVGTKAAIQTLLTKCDIKAEHFCLFYDPIKHIVYAALYTVDSDLRIDEHRVRTVTLDVMRVVWNVPPKTGEKVYLAGNWDAKLRRPMLPTHLLVAPKTAAAATATAAGTASSKTSGNTSDGGASHTDESANEKAIKEAQKLEDEHRRLIAAKSLKPVVVSYVRVFTERTQQHIKEEPTVCTTVHDVVTRRAEFNPLYWTHANSSRASTFDAIGFLQVDTSNDAAVHVVSTVRELVQAKKRAVMAAAAAASRSESNTNGNAVVAASNNVATRADAATVGGSIISNNSTVTLPSTSSSAQTTADSVDDNNDNTTTTTVDMSTSKTHTPKRTPAAAAVAENGHTKTKTKGAVAAVPAPPASASPAVLTRWLSDATLKKSPLANAKGTDTEGGEQTIWTRAGKLLGIQQLPESDGDANISRVLTRASDMLNRTGDFADGTELIALCKSTSLFDVMTLRTKAPTRLVSHVIMPCLAVGSVAMLEQITPVVATAHEKIVTDSVTSYVDTKVAPLESELESAAAKLASVGGGGGGGGKKRSLVDTCDAIASELTAARKKLAVLEATVESTTTKLGELLNADASAGNGKKLTLEQSCEAVDTLVKELRTAAAKDTNKMGLNDEVDESAMFG